MLDATTPLPPTPAPAQPTPRARAGALRPTDPAPPVPAPGTHVGRFVVLETLGEGGMGIVLSAYDAALDRKVAIKLLRPHLRGDESNASGGHERLVREARAMARLEHPNVVRVHEAGTWNEQVFIAMEFAGGGTLKRWMREETRPWRDVLALLVQAGRGLWAAHQAGLVHRDFKPENVLLDTDGQAHVADFGLVSAGGVTIAPREAAPAAGDIRGDTSAVTSLTMTGTIMGTPSYMAPEQHRGERVGAAADQFAFCVTAWEALYGARPFVGASFDELRAAIFAGDPPDMAIGDVPPRIQAVLRRGLAADPAARWPSMGALLAALEDDPAARRRRGFVLAGSPARRGGRRDRRARAGGRRRRRALRRVRAPPRRRVGRRAARAAGRAFTAAAPSWGGETARLVAGALDADARAWVGARRGVQGHAARRAVRAPARSLRMSCLDRRLHEMRAVVDVLIAEADPDVLARAPTA